ncbi:TIGR04141 family sporadically distributed protein [Streptococcus suis]|nr:TIGR04141 family sporadically distributed protein [Streptococcus suis]
MSNFQKYNIVLHNKESFEECLKDEFQDKKDYFIVDTTEGAGIEEGRIYIANTTDSPVEWIEELNKFTTSTISEEDYKNKSNKALLMLKYQKKIFSILYGYGRTMLKNSSIVKNFGLKTAINLISENNIKSINTLNISTDYIDTQRQSFNYVSQNFLDIKTDSEIIKSISGKASSNTSFNNIHGSDALQISVKANTTVSKVLKEILNFYQGEQYKEKGFEWIDFIQPVKEDSVKLALDKQLIVNIREKNIEKISIGSNKLIDLSVVDGYFISGMKIRANYNNFYDDIPTELFLEYLEPMIENEIASKLNNSSLYFWNNKTGKSEKIDKVYNCLLFETEYEDERYFLNNGEWFKIESDYYTSILQKIDSIPRSTIEPIACEINWNEAKYNEEFAKTKPSDYQSFDKQNYQVPSWGKSKIEPADIITRDRKFIHVKKGGSSSSLSHLFAQGLVSAQLLKNDNDYIKHIEKKVQAKFGTSFIENNEIEVVFGVIDKRYKEKFDKFLPVFSMINLSQVYDNILNLGYKCSILPIELKISKNRSQNETAVIDILSSGKWYTIKAIGDKVSLKMSKETIRKIVNKLVTDGEIECEKIGRKNSYRKIG